MWWSNIEKRPVQTREENLLIIAEYREKKKQKELAVDQLTKKFKLPKRN